MTENVKKPAENGKKVAKIGKLKNGNPAHTLTMEEQRKGGIASGKLRKERKTFAETLDIILKRVPKDKGIIEKLKLNGFEKEDINTQLILLDALVNSGIKKGDPSIAAFIRDTVGEKPKDQVEILEPPEIPPLPEE